MNHTYLFSSDGSLIMMTWTRSILLIATTVSLVNASLWRNEVAFVVGTNVERRHPSRALLTPSRLRMAPIEIENDDDDDEEDVEPGKMRVSEIKAELDLRGVAYADCFDKESLVKRLEDARLTGKADPSILNEFNKRKLEENFSEKKLEVKDEDIAKAVAGDGTLPGGMSPEMFQKLIADPEIMTLLQSTKMQEAMKLMMTGGREDLEAAIAADPEMQQIISKLNDVLRSVD